MDGNLYQKVVEHENRPLDRNARKECVLVTFLTVVTKWLTRSHRRKKGFVSAHSLKRGDSHHGRKSMVAGMGGNWSHCFHSKEADLGWEMGSSPQSDPRTCFLQQGSSSRGFHNKTEHPAESQV